MYTYKKENTYTQLLPIVLSGHGRINSREETHEGILVWDPFSLLCLHRKGVAFGSTAISSPLVTEVNKNEYLWVCTATDAYPFKCENFTVVVEYAFNTWFSWYLSVLNFYLRFNLNILFVNFDFRFHFYWLFKTKFLNIWGTHNSKFYITFAVLKINICCIPIVYANLSRDSQRYPSLIYHRVQSLLWHYSIGITLR